MLIQAIRTLIFYALFIGQTAVLAIFLGVVSLFVRRWSNFGIRVGRYWGASNLFFLRWIVGIRTEVTGLENIPSSGCIIASKHQSDWDIFALLPLVERPAFIAKKELMDIPFFGRAARTLEAITIDRKRGGDAIPDMQRQAKGAIERGCHIVIFPEGTRSPALIPGDYKIGTSKLYEALDVPIVPVALNSGLFWPRNGLVMWPGTARARILEPIPPGLTARQVQARMKKAIESACDELYLQADKEGIARPLRPEMLERLALLRKKAATAPDR